MSAARHASSLPPALISLLHRVAGRHLTLRLVGGVSTLLAVALGVLIGQLLFDRLLDFPRAVRLAFLVVDAALLTFLLRRHVYLPWRKRWHERDAAFALQRRWPNLGSSVISALELAPSPAAAPGAPSSLLVASLITETGRRTAQLKAPEVVPGRPAWRRATHTALFVAVAVALAWWQWPDVSVLLARATLSDQPLPTATIVVPETRDLRAVSGDNVTLAALAQGRLPAQGRIELVAAGRERRTLVVAPDESNPARFTVTVPNVRDSFTYRFYLGDGRGPVFNVAPLPAPLVEQIEFIQEFPAYTGRKSTRHPAGALTLFPGSRVRVSARANQPLRSAQIRFAGENSTLAPADLGVDAAAPRLISGEFTVPASGLTGLSLPVINTDGVPSSDNTLYPVQLEFDRPPVVTLEQPTAASETLTSIARLDIVARVRDDFVVDRAELVFEINGEERRRPLTIGPGGRIQTSIAPATETPPLADGTQAGWWIEAFDNNNVTGPGRGLGERRQFTIVSLAEKQAEVLKRLEETSRRLDEAARRQGEVRGALGEALRRSTEIPPPSD